MWRILNNPDGTWTLAHGDEEPRIFGSAEEAVAALQVELAEAARVFADEPQDETGDGRRRVLLRLLPLGVETSDGRLIESAYSRDMPLPLMLQTVTEVGHYGAELAGAIESVEERDGVMWASAVTDSSEAGQQTVQILQEHGRFGVSADIGQVGEIDFECRLEDEDGWCVDGLATFRDAELIGGTLTPFPAFADAWAELEGGEAVTAAGAPALVTAGERYGAPVAPPAAWFSRPLIEDPDERRMLHVTPEGRVFTYVALHGECHIGHRDVCVTPPLTRTQYAYFLTGHVVASDGARTPVGQITLAGGHAPIHLPWQLAIAHYDETRAGVADVLVGEDEHGIWAAGALRPDATHEQVRVLRACGVSGDWRDVRDGLELIAVASVNVPGFPKVRARVASGRMVALVAAGSPPVPTPEPVPIVAAGMSRARPRRTISERRLAAFEDRLARMERRVAALNPEVRTRLLEGVAP